MRLREEENRRRIEAITKEYMPEKAPVQAECTMLGSSAYLGAAMPIGFLEIQNIGWDNTEQGLPVYVNLKEFGAGMAFATKVDEAGIRWYAAGIFDIPTKVVSTAVPTNRPQMGSVVGPIKCNTLWKVKSDYVTMPEMVVRMLLSNPRDPSGVDVEMLCRKKDSPDKREYPYVKTLSWSQFVSYEKKPGTPENVALALFRKDNAARFMTDRTLLAPSSPAATPVDVVVAKTPAPISSQPPIVEQTPLPLPAEIPVEKEAEKNKEEGGGGPESSIGHRYVTEQLVGAPFILGNWQ